MEHCHRNKQFIARTNENQKIAGCRPLKTGACPKELEPGQAHILKAFMLRMYHGVYQFCFWHVSKHVSKCWFQCVKFKVCIKACIECRVAMYQGMYQMSCCNVSRQEGDVSNLRYVSGHVSNVVLQCIKARGRERDCEIHENCSQRLG